MRIARLTSQSITFPIRDGLDYAIPPLPPRFSAGRVTPILAAGWGGRHYVHARYKVGITFRVTGLCQKLHSSSHACTRTGLPPSFHTPTHVIPAEYEHVSCTQIDNPAKVYIFRRQTTAATRCPADEASPCKLEALRRHCSTPSDVAARGSTSS